MKDTSLKFYLINNIWKVSCDSCGEYMTHEEMPHHVYEKTNVCVECVAMYTPQQFSRRRRYPADDITVECKACGDEFISRRDRKFCPDKACRSEYSKAQAKMRYQKNKESNKKTA